MKFSINDNIQVTPNTKKNIKSYIEFKEIDNHECLDNKHESLDDSESNNNQVFSENYKKLQNITHSEFNKLNNIQDAYYKKEFDDKGIDHKNLDFDTLHDMFDIINYENTSLIDIDDVLVRYSPGTCGVLSSSITINKNNERRICLDIKSSFRMLDNVDDIFEKIINVILSGISYKKYDIKFLIVDEDKNNLYFCDIKIVKNKSKLLLDKYDRQYNILKKDDIDKLKQKYKIN